MSLCRCAGHSLHVHYPISAGNLYSPDPPPNALPLTQLKLPMGAVQQLHIQGTSPSRIPQTAPPQPPHMACFDGITVGNVDRQAVFRFHRKMLAHLPVPQNTCLRTRSAGFACACIFSERSPEGRLQSPFSRPSENPIKPHGVAERNTRITQLKGEIPCLTHLLIKPPSAKSP